MVRAHSLMKLQQSDETLRGVEWDSEADRPNPQPIVQWPRFYLPQTIFQNPNHETIPIPANETHHALMLSTTNHTAFCVQSNLCSTTAEHYSYQKPPTYAKRDSLTDM